MRALLTILCLAVAGCATSSQQSPRVDRGDGIDKSEAASIADEYLQKHMSATLGHIGPYDGGSVWIFKITGDVVPVEFTNVPPVLVDKKSGDVTWDAKPPLKR